MKKIQELQRIEKDERKLNEGQGNEEKGEGRK